MNEEDYNKIHKEVSDLLVAIWNDIANRDAGEILFKEHKDILTAHSEIMEIIKKVGSKE